MLSTRFQLCWTLFCNGNVWPGKMPGGSLRDAPDRKKTQDGYVSSPNTAHMIYRLNHVQAAQDNAKSENLAMIYMQKSMQGHSAVIRFCISNYFMLYITFPNMKM